MSDSYTPRTTETRLTLPLNGTIYTTRRAVSAEKPTPTVGDAMTAELGSAWSDSYIIAANIVPDGDKEVQQIIHARIPTLANQLSKNWTLTTVNIAGVELDAVERYFVTLASDYNATTPPVDGASVIDSSAGDPFYNDRARYFLTNREVIQSGVDLEPVFKVEKRLYVHVPTETDQLPDNWGHSERVIGGVEIPVIDRFFVFLASGFDPASPAIGASMPNESGGPFESASPAYLLVDREEVGSQEPIFPIFKIERRSYAQVGTTTAQLPNNWNWSSADLGGTRFPAVQRTFLRLASDVLAAKATDPVAGSAMPVSVSSSANDYLFNGEGYIQVTRGLERATDDLHPLFVLDRRQYVKRSVTDVVGIDDLNGLPMRTTRTLYYGTEAGISGMGAATIAAAFDDSGDTLWGIQASGVRRSGRQLTSDWYEVIEETVIGGGGSGSGPFAIQGYQTMRQFYWPPVLQQYGAKQWERKDGSFETYPFVKMDPEAFRGPCKVDVAVTWQKTAATLAPDTPLQPKPIYYASPGFRLNIPACLHGTIAVSCDYGTGHPVFAPNVGSQEIFTATSHTTWPSTLIIKDEQRPFRGGYLRTKMTVHKPA